MKKTKIIITAAIMAALVTATACGGKDQASTPTEAQTTTTAVKQVNSINTENTIQAGSNRSFCRKYSVF